MGWRMGGDGGYWQYDGGWMDSMVVMMDGGGYSGDSGRMDIVLVQW